jgi:hypothetical protein
VVKGAGVGADSCCASHRGGAQIDGKAAGAQRASCAPQRPPRKRKSAAAAQRALSAPRPPRQRGEKRRCRRRLLLGAAWWGAKVDGSGDGRRDVRALVAGGVPLCDGARAAWFSMPVW